MKKTTDSTRQTVEFAKNLAGELKGGNIVALYGDLGAGKTNFAKGIAQALGIEEEITSPTFSLMNVYKIKNNKESKIKNLVHIDTYRLKNEQELIDIGAEDYLGDPETLCVIEWPEKIKSLLRVRQTKSVTIMHDVADANRRIIIVS